MTDPYADALDAYWAAGWRGVLPLPFKRKTHPPDGYTGRHGAFPSYPDAHAWTENGPHNIALRVPRHVVGVDVDHYDEKRGGDTLTGLVGKCGPLPPTVMSTSRNDGISGIRLYKIPEGTETISKLPGIEFIQYHHRYIVAWPSIHPITGQTYQWLDERTGDIIDAVPSLDDIPDLPTKWVDGLSAEAAEYSKANLDAYQARDLLNLMPIGDPCQHITKAVGTIAGGGDRHDVYNDAALALVGAGRRGCPGALPAIGRLRSLFIAEVTTGATNKRSLGEAKAEWDRNLRGALAIIANETQGVACPDDVLEYVQSLPEPNNGPGPQTPDNGPQLQYDINVRRKALELRTIEDARELLATDRAGAIPELPCIDLRTFLDQPDDPIRYRVNGLWPAEGRVLLAAAAKAGKTTLLSGNLIPALLDGGDFLGAHTVQPTTGNVVLFNMEVGEATLRAWMRRAGIINAHKLIVANLRGRASLLTIATTHGRKRVAEYLKRAGAEAVCLDPLAPLLAAHGLDENLNSDIARFFSWWSETMADAGVKDDLIVHHTGHDGARSRGASRLLDEPDAIWNLTKDKTPETADDDETDVWGTVTPRYLSAFGRDVELAETGLAFDGVTRKLTVSGGSRSDVRKATRNDPIRAAIVEYIAANPGATSRDVRGVKGKATTIDVLLARLITSGEIVVYAGENGAQLHYLRGRH